MTSQFRMFVLTVALAITALSIRVAAQGQLSALSGTVVDQTGAVIAGASIAVRRDAAGFVRDFRTDDEGRFLIGELVPGEYIVRVTSPGFTASGDRVLLQSGQ